MKALTIYQPWASLECLGLKGTETRGRGMRYRGPLAIHAGMMLDPAALLRINRYLVYELMAEPLPAFLPRGVILCVTEVLDSIEVSEDNQTQFSEADRELGDCSVGRHVIVLGKPRVLRTPIPCRGAQGLWTVPAEIAGQILDQLAPGDRRRDLARDAKLEADRDTR